eukprot:NODE_5501_length_576_cov_326.159309.p4 GENE.NODE_5501_length_576_cov_326.159309~~NODE_5501_length_576_cov_326.159309.p4  ORF type:complete len:64 (-),score=7.72 NODE_5501_length_576_cov_326.159309:265-456(-)
MAKGMCEARDCCIGFSTSRVARVAAADMSVMTAPPIAAVEPVVRVHAHAHWLFHQLVQGMASQ